MQDIFKFSLIKSIVIVCTCLMSLTVRAEQQPLKILAVNYPPYEFETPVDGLKGYDVEVVEEVFRRLEIKAKVEFLPWARAVKYAYEGLEMAILSCAHSKERDANLYLSDTISVASDGYFMREDFTDPEFNSFEELRGHKITSVRGYISQKELENNDIEHLEADSDEQALRVLVAKRVDFFYGPKEGAVYFAKGLGFSDKLKFHTFNTLTYHLCFSKKWPGSKELVDKFNTGLATLKADGTYKKFHDKYR